MNYKIQFIFALEKKYDFPGNILIYSKMLLYSISLYLLYSKI